ncbi:MAG: peptide chain release factor N(5)-glutamine methyltransferase [Chloroflexi bacterium]|jgi:release factor glutamine methyltransferase|nr:peptide chain release factor N(5)-glutamine methyltransferase [Dehalococcoidia bacterium]PKB81477.1 MAG: protein-(glutamine-N5) methyltransferase, release factor-specific [SAR202 cluster bacterium MP-SInd-SRR3963457-G1]PKB84972.1 MAG: protein-(glutamine-N5) methyltransferase, release factor-specific [SAR202 cluster bacterium MP-NPac-SRR3961935-G1]RUA32009.1 MAG: peptide chain release factor N(5)-glutamine methyltransferase [Chloroflexota bacterium]
MPVLRTIIQDTHKKLESAGIPDARLEAEVLVMNVMRMARQSIFAEQETEVTGQQQAALDEFLERRYSREPLAYILGQREFYGINVVLTPAVLIPRPETEGLVEQALFMALMGMESTELTIADVGTGSGAIAINLAIHLPSAKIYAVDVQDAVLDVAAYNVRVHGVADRVNLAIGDLLDAVPEPVDLIVANLPYIPTDRIPTLQPEVQQEPVLALDGGPDGLDLVRRLLIQAEDKLNSHGIILLEIDPDQIPVVQELALQHFPEGSTSVEKDLAGMDRILSIHRQAVE